MNIGKINRVLLDDLEDISNSGISFEQLRNSNILITGATGLVGSMLVKALLFLNVRDDLNLTLLALVRDPEKANNVFADFLPDSALRYVVADLMKDDLVIRHKVDYIIHAASVTTSKLMVEKPVETIYTAIHGTEKALDLAKEKYVRSFVYISSMEMYGTFNDDEMVSEDKIGYIDPLNVRSNYPESKRMCENLCVAFYSEYNIPIKIARLSQTFGAGVLPTEKRVFAQFAKSAMEGKDIVLHTKGLSEGNYSYLAETIQAIILILLKGQNGEAYNVVNEACHTTIADMAEMVARDIADGNINVVFDIPSDNIHGYAADTHMKLSSNKLRSLGWQPKINLLDAYKRMIKYMSSEPNN